ncbi:hypothetical protein CYMTET_22598 [Cymbomonas tetramitiformis]|uniref:Calmodulin n=1 Tax=Cymbomonas tetramitiformis TaxID=36881 RepID=A0AAE0FZK4_9CHLO|nr:hypothetical protein CYMTET_22598 [Cymbomonas tetramitiformis]
MPRGRKAVLLQKQVADEELQQRRSDFKEIFDSLDSDGSGTLDFEEFLRAFATLGVAVDAKMLRSQFDELDTDGGGDLSFEEFYHLASFMLFGQDMESRVHNCSRSEARKILKLPNSEREINEVERVCNYLMATSTFFKQVSYEVAFYLCQHVRLEHIPRGVWVFTQGRKGSCMYCVLTGSVSIFQKDPNAAEPMEDLTALRTPAENDAAPTSPTSVSGAPAKKLSKWQVKQRNIKLIGKLRCLTKKIDLASSAAQPAQPTEDADEPQDAGSMDAFIAHLAQKRKAARKKQMKNTSQAIFQRANTGSILGSCAGSTFQPLQDTGGG